MSFFLMIKLNAKKALRLYWGQAIAIVLLSSALHILFAYLQWGFTYFFNVFPPEHYLNFPGLHYDDPRRIFATFGITWGFGLLYSLFSIPLSIGIKKWFIHLSQGEALSVSAVFHFFSQPRLFGRALLLKFLIFIRVYGFTLVLILPLAFVMGIGITAFASAQSVEQGMLGLGTMLLFFAMMLLVILIVTLFQNRYYAAQYILAMNDTLTASQAIRLSVRATKGRIFSILLFDLSFIGWFLLSIFVLPNLYYIPYYSTSRGIYVRFMLEAIGCRWIGNAESDIPN